MALNSVSLELEPVCWSSARLGFGWHAWVDGKEARVLRVNGIVQGFPIEAGRHPAELRYWARGLRLGVIVSLTTLTFFIGWMTLTRLRATVTRPI
jgi:uncharacterized membrane protein YfhO